MLLDQLVGVLDKALQEVRRHIADEIFKLRYFFGVAGRNFVVKLALTVIDLDIDLLDHNAFVVLEVILGLLAVLRDIVRVFARRNAAT